MRCNEVFETPADDLLGDQFDVCDFAIIIRHKPFPVERMIRLETLQGLDEPSSRGKEPSLYTLPSAPSADPSLATSAWSRTSA
jgi:hypothetical protein